MAEDIRWKQRFSNLKKAFSQLKSALSKGEYSELERQGVIQCFEYTFELSWNTLKDFLEEQGYRNINGPKDAIQESFNIGLIEDGEEWMNMIKSRNLTSLTYNEETAEEVFEEIKENYFSKFEMLISKFEKEN
ncbi:MAG: nucleotidyltransferase substrate binding protein [Ignavibacteria bacterium]|nr:nucleotidyltransferase substrate binding protein [Ignavibacteria bacterium]